WVLNVPFTVFPATICTFAMLFWSSWVWYSVYVICFVESAFPPESWMRTIGMSRMRIQNARVFMKRPHVNSRLFFGGIGTGITASSLCTECAENFRRDLTHTPPGTRWVHQIR